MIEFLFTWPLYWGSAAILFGSVIFSLVTSPHTSTRVARNVLAAIAGFWAVLTVSILFVLWVAA